MAPFQLSNFLGNDMRSNQAKQNELAYNMIQHRQVQISQRQAAFQLLLCVAAPRSARRHADAKYLKRIQDSEDTCGFTRTHIVEEGKTVCLSWLPHHQKRSCRIDDLFSQPDLLPRFQRMSRMFFLSSVTGFCLPLRPSLQARLEVQAHQCPPPGLNFPSKVSLSNAKK